jgi:hypothetical protein
VSQMTSCAAAPAYLRPDAMAAHMVSQSADEEEASIITSEVAVCDCLHLLDASSTFRPSKFAQTRRVRVDLLPSRVIANWCVPSDGVCGHG